MTVVALAASDVAASLPLYAERLQTIGGQPPNLQRLPEGCTFRDRCPLATAVCAQPVKDHAVGPDHRAKCWLYVDGEFPAPPTPFTHRPPQR